MLSWSTDKQQICKRIVASETVFKIILKTKNEKLFLKKWIDHHSDIVGPSGIIIMDNGSEEPEVIKAYGSINPDVTIFSFEGVHNNIHDTRQYHELYQALRQSCDYFLFIDTDEFLVQFHNGIFDASSRIIHDFMKFSADPFIPTTMLYNKDGSAEHFSIEGGITRLVGRSLRWGKPAVKSSAGIEGFINHNCQINRNNFNSEKSSPFAILHLANFSIEQRIMTNMNKLAARGIVKRGTTVSDLLAMDPKSLAGANDNNYIAEVRRLAILGRYEFDANEPASPEFIKFRIGAQTEFHSQQDRDVVDTYFQTKASTRNIIPYP